jgi:hypothetical protein
MHERPSATVRLPNKLSSTRGFGDLRSCAMKAASPKVAAPSMANIAGLVQETPSSPRRTTLRPSDRATRSGTTAPPSRRAPATSRLGRGPDRAVRSGGIFAQTKASASAPIGTLTKNTHGQPR